MGLIEAKREERALPEGWGWIWMEKTDAPVEEIEKRKNKHNIHTLKISILGRIRKKRVEKEDRKEPEWKSRVGRGRIEDPAPKYGQSFSN